MIIKLANELEQSQVNKKLLAGGTGVGALAGAAVGLKSGLRGKGMLGATVAGATTGLATGHEASEMVKESDKIKKAMTNDDKYARRAAYGATGAVLAGGALLSSLDEDSITGTIVNELSRNPKAKHLKKGLGIAALGSGVYGAANYGMHRYQQNKLAKM